jgi:hypothetical protein
MAVALRAQDAGPAATAVMLILICNMLRGVRQLMPNGNFDVLKNPMVRVAPSFLASLAASPRQVG